MLLRITIPLVVSYSLLHITVRSAAQAYQPIDFISHSGPPANFSLRFIMLADPDWFHGCLNVGGVSPIDDFPVSFN